MDASGFLLGGAGIAAVAGLWGKIQAVVNRLASIVIQTVELDGGHYGIHTSQIVGHIIKNYKMSRFYNRVYLFDWGVIKEYNNSGHIAVESYANQSMLFWIGKSPLFYGKIPQKQDNNQQAQSKKVFWFIKGTIDFDKIVADSIKEYNKELFEQQNRKNRFAIRYIPDIGQNESKDTSCKYWWEYDYNRLIGYHKDDLGTKTHSVNLLDHLFYPDSVTKIIQDVVKWKNSKDWYENKNIVWKMGLLLYGPPGTGKSILVRAIAEYLDLPIYVFNLSEVSNTEFVENWRNMRTNTPCIALIEDFDNIFHGRENIAAERHGGFFSLLARTQRKNNNLNSTSEDKEDENRFKGRGGALTFDTFINCLDGVDKSDGILTIITTNDVSKLDEAIGKPAVQEDGSINFVSSRPGRIDRAVHLGYMDKECKKKMASKFLKDYPQGLNEVLTHIEHNTQETPAQFQERCVRIALDYYWKNR